MQGISVEDINEQVVFAFVLCYGYNMSISELLKIYHISTKMYTHMLEVMSPAISLTTRKRQIINAQVRNILGKLKGSNVELTDLELTVYKLIKLYTYDVFSNGSKCITFDKLINKKYICGTQDGEITATISEDDLPLLNYIKDDCTLYKTNKITYLAEKYFGDMPMRELSKAGLKTLESRLAEVARGYVNA